MKWGWSKKFNRPWKIPMGFKKGYTPWNKGHRTSKKFNLTHRFKDFIRDKFTCQYCGRKAPNIILQIDHVFPKVKGGTDDLSNLKTACQDCNVGKKDIILFHRNKLK